MTNNDNRLTRRLTRLEQAVPAPRWGPDELWTAMNAAPARQPARFRGRRLFLLFAPVALLAAGTIALAEGNARPEAPDTALDAAIRDVFGRTQCLPAGVAKPAIAQRLADLGRTGWTIEERPGAATANCVAAVAFSEDRLILLFPAAGETVSKAMEAAAADLLARCLSRDEAVAYMQSVLSDLGLAGTPIRIDPAAHTGPIALIEDYERHVAAGCYVYAGYQHDAEGKPFVILWGTGS